MRLLPLRPALFVLVSAQLLACGGPTPPRTASEGTVGNAEMGGRLYDKWFVGKGFTPDGSKTPGVADGKGGPFGNGTLPDAGGKPLLNDAGHDYRLKNLFGWDLRGAAGLYGSAGLQKGYAADHDLLADRRSARELSAWLAKGEGKIPAYETVLSTTELLDLATFITSVRDHQLPHPDDLFVVKPKAEGGYSLVPGGDPERGKALLTARCTGCHGKDGTTILFDEGEENVGTLTRKKAYEVWAKLTSGHPGSPMRRQVQGDAAAMTRELRDMLAAACDRKAYPKGTASQPDVADGDARCGAHLR